MTQRAKGLFVGVSLAVVSACGLVTPQFVGLPVEARFAVANLSLEHYAAFSVREHRDEPGEYTRIALLPPGGAADATFLSLIGSSCPGSLDLRLALYRRVNADMPIGLDEGEMVDPTPVVAGETLGVPACDVEVTEGYTVVNWEAEDGVARVKIAQDTGIEDAIADMGLFDGPDGTWQIEGVDPSVAADGAPDVLPANRLSGRVTLADGTGVEGVGVLIRTRFRVRLDDADPGNDPDAGFGEPIAFAITDANGSFSFERPGGVYQVECFSDDLLFRPEAVIVQSPVDVIGFIAEPAMP